MKAITSITIAALLSACTTAEHVRPTIDSTLDWAAQPFARRRAPSAHIEWRVLTTEKEPTKAQPPTAEQKPTTEQEPTQ